LNEPKLGWPTTTAITCFEMLVINLAYDINFTER
jgi:hypothetical protein